MNDAVVTKLISDALMTLLWIVSPMLAMAIIVGVIVSLIQTLTSIQDQTFSFAPRVIVIFGVFLFSFSWILNLLINFAESIFSSFAPFVQ